MSDKSLQSYLTVSTIIGFFIDFILLLILNTQNKELYNCFTVGICSFIPLLVFSMFINYKLYSFGKLNIKKSIIILFIYLFISFISGFLIEYLLIDKLLKKDIVNIVRMVNALYQSSIGILVSIWFSYDYYKKIVK